MASIIGTFTGATVNLWNMSPYEASGSVEKFIIAFFYAHLWYKEYVYLLDMDAGLEINFFQGPNCIFMETSPSLGSLQKLEAGELKGALSNRHQLLNFEPCDENEYTIIFQ